MSSTRPRWRFVETQRFARRWLAGALLGAAGIVLGVAWLGAEPPPDVAFGVLVVAAIGGSLYVVRLETRVGREGVYLKFFPPDLAFDRVSPGAIESVEVREYSRVRLLTGAGIGPRTYAVAGRRAVLIRRLDGPDLVVGTRRPEALAGAIESVREVSARSGKDALREGRYTMGGKS